MDTVSNQAQGRSKGTAGRSRGQNNSSQEVSESSKSTGEVGAESATSKDATGIRLMESLDTRFSTHEAVCAERWKETILRIKRIEAILIASAGAIILLLLNIAVKGH